MALLRSTALRRTSRQLGAVQWYVYRREGFILLPPTTVPQSLRIPTAHSLNTSIPTYPSSRRAFTSLHPLRVSTTTPRQAASIEPTKPTDAYQILVNQRLHRPVSPHLSIYRPQITWYASALNRITGSLLSGSFYLFGAAYLASPLFGWHLESASLAAAFASWPVWAKVVTKFVASWPLTFHALNGMRHLVWDVGYWLTNKQIIRTGWAVVGLSMVGSLILAFY